MDAKRLPKVRIAAISALITIIVSLEVLQFPESFRFFSLVVSFLLVLGIASLSGGIVRDILVVVTSLVAGGVVVEGIAAIAEPKISMHVSNGLYDQNPLLGWGPSRAGRYHEERIDSASGKTIFSVDYTIGENLLRSTQSADFGPPIVFFGDSLTFGAGLNDPDTLPQQFADLLNRKVPVLNAAFNGYGPSQFLRILQEDLFTSIIGSEQKFFVFLTASWQSERTACKSNWTRLAPSFVLESDEPILKGTCRDRQWIWLRDRLQPFATYRLLLEPLILKPTDEDIELYIRVLSAAVRLAENRYGVRTILPYLRSSGYLQTTGFTDESIMERLRASGAIVIDASLQQEESQGAVLSIPGDGHPTRLANNLRAKMLKDYIERNMDRTLLSGLK
jgi:hypothetical protein